MEIQNFSKEMLDYSKGLLLYGAGAWGKLVLETLQSWISESEVWKARNIPIFFIDRLKNDSNFEGVDIIRKTDIGKFPGFDILICAPSAYVEIIHDLQELCEDGLDHVFGISEFLRNPTPKTYVNVHDCLCGDILLEKYDYYKTRNMVSKKESVKEIVIPFLSISVTERCSLNCEKCIAMVPYYLNPQNFTFNDMKSALERLVNSVDRILEVGFVGGEVFMNKEFYKYVEWAIAQSKIRSVTVLTNATLLPDNKMIKLLKHEKVAFGIDNYGSLSSKIDALISLAEEEKIKYYILYNECWQDIGTLERKNYSQEKKNEIFRNCSFKDCHLFLKGKVYRCQHEAHLDNLSICKSPDKDFLDLTVESSSEEIREKLAKLLTKTEALEACDFCNDITKHMFRIPVAEQRVRGHR